MVLQSSEREIEELAAELDRLKLAEVEVSTLQVVMRSDGRLQLPATACSCRLQLPHRGCLCNGLQRSCGCILL